MTSYFGKNKQINLSNRRNFRIYRKEFLFFLNIKSEEPHIKVWLSGFPVLCWE